MNYCSTVKLPSLVTSGIFIITCLYHHWYFNIYFVILLIWLYHRKSVKPPFLALELTTGGECVLIPIMQLSFCPSYYDIKKPSIGTITVSDFPSSKIYANWSNFIVTDKRTDKTITVFLSIRNSLSLQLLIFFYFTFESQDNHIFNFFWWHMLIKISSLYINSMCTDIYIYIYIVSRLSCIYPLEWILVGNMYILFSLFFSLSCFISFNMFILCMFFFTW